MMEWKVSPCRTCILDVIAFRLRTTFGGFPLGTGRNRAAGGVRLVAASLNRGLRTGYWSYKTARITQKQQNFGLMQHHRELAKT